MEESPFCMEKYSRSLTIERQNDSIKDQKYPRFQKPVKKLFIIKAKEHKTVFRITRNNVNNRIIGSKSYVVRVPFEH